MAKTGPVLPLANEETARLKWFQAFMRGRVELEQQTISGLQALLEGAPPLPERKMLWHCALEDLLGGTRNELQTRVEELETLKNQMQAVEMSISEAEKCICDLNIEFKKLESTESVASAQTAAATSHNDWLETKSVGVSVQKSLSDLFSSKEKLEHEKRLKTGKACEKYYKQDLKYRHILHQQRQSQDLFLNSIPHRIQEYATKYWTAVRDVGTVMESFSNYLRDTSSICNSSGSALWASAKNIKPLVDANCHMGAIEFARHQSPIRFTPVYYQNPRSKSYSPHRQTILFGCPLELCTVGEPKKIPPILEYLLDSVGDWPEKDHRFLKVEKYWPLVNEIEQAWTDVEEIDRAFVSKLVQYDLVSLIMVYLRTLPKPILSSDDAALAVREFFGHTNLIWSTWSKDPIKAIVLQAILACHSRINHSAYFGFDIGQALTQKEKCVAGMYLTRLSRYPEIWRAPSSNVDDESQ